jgi:hypothetical protein
MADPWMKFYPADWMSEPKLKLVSRAARSLWIDMLCLMHQAGTGRLEVSGRPMTERELSSILGDNPRTVRKLLAELADAGVSTIVDGSFVASSRIIRDFEKAEKDRSNGRMGGSPALKTRENVDIGVNPEDKAQKPQAICQKLDNGGDGSAGAESALVQDQQTEREELLVAMGHHPTGLTANGRVIGTLSDMSERSRWSDLGLSHSQQLEVIRDMMRQKRDGPPSSFKYFTGGMQRLAGALTAPPLRAIAGGLQPAPRTQFKPNFDDVELS